MKRRYLNAQGESVAMPDAGAVSLTTCHDGTVLVVDGGVVRPVLATPIRDQVWLSHGTTTARITREQKKRGGADDAGSAVIAPMTGRIVVVSAAPGDAVKKGDPLVVIEAMKMEQPLKAPRDGVVAKVSCAEGQLVDGGVVLVSLSKESA